MTDYDNAEINLILYEDNKYSIYFCVLNLNIRKNSEGLLINENTSVK